MHNSPQNNVFTKVAVISLYPMSATGGGENYTFNCAKSVSIDNVECDLIAPVDHSFVGDRSQHRFDQVFVKRTILQSKVIDIQNFNFRQLLSSINSYDYIWIHQYMASASIYDLLTITNPNQKIFFTNLGFEANANEFWIRYNPFNNHLFVEISEFSQNRARKYTRNVEYVYSGIWRENLGLSLDFNGYKHKQKNMLVSVGRVLPHKGFEIAIDALSYDMALIIIGTFSESDYVSYLKMRSHGKTVNFTNKIIDSEKDKIISSSLGLIANSVSRTYQNQEFEHSELLGLVIIEALANGTLPITSNQPALNEVMCVLGLDDFVYIERDVESLQSKIKLLYSLGMDEYISYLKKAVEVVKQKFLWDDYWGRVKQKIEDRYNINNQ